MTKREGRTPQRKANQKKGKSSSVAVTGKKRTSKRLRQERSIRGKSWAVVGGRRSSKYERKNLGKNRKDLLQIRGQGKR